VAVLVAAGVGAAVAEIGARTLLQRVAGIELLGHAFAAVEGVQMAMLTAWAFYVSALVAVGGPVAAPIVETTRLRHVPALAALGAQEPETLARSARRLDVTAGAVLWRQGDARALLRIR